MSGACIAVPADLAGFVVSARDFALRARLNPSSHAVWSAVHTRTRRLCLVKALPLPRLSAGQARWYLEEASALARAASPFLFRFVGFTDRAPFYIATEFGALASAADALARGALSATDLTVVALGVAGALRRLHACGLALPHLSLHTVFLGAGRRPRVAAFAAAPRAPKWQPPELYDGGAHERPSDVFCFAMVLYEMATGREAFAAMERVAVARTFAVHRKKPPLPPGLGSGLRAMIRHCWRTDPALRPEMPEICAAFASGEVYFQGCDLTVLKKVIASQDFVAAPARGPAELASDGSWGGSPDGPKDGGGDLDVFADPEDRNFFNALDYVGEDLQENQLSEFFAIIARPLAEGSPDVVSAILVALLRLLPRETAVRAFVDARLLDRLPFNDLRHTDAIFEILRYVVEVEPQALESGFHLQISELVTRQPKKGLVLLAFFGKEFNSLENPLSLLGLLIKHDRLFFKSDAACDYISLLCFLNANFPKFRREHFNSCRQIFTSFRSSSDPHTVQVAYSALCALSDVFTDIPLEHILANLHDQVLASSALSILLRLPKIPVKQELVNSLLGLAERNREATLVLLKLATSSLDGSALLVDTPDWLHKFLPELLDTIRLVLAIMAWETLRDRVSRMSDLPAFMLAIVQSHSQQEILCLGSICKRLTMNEDTLEAVRQISFFGALLKMIQSLNGSPVRYIGIDLVTMFALVDDCDEYLEFIPILKEALIARDDKVQRSTFLAFYVLSRFRNCVLQFKKLRLDQMVRQVVIGEAQAKRVAKFVQTVEAAE
jgi:hypothetical protein